MKSVAPSLATHKSAGTASTYSPTFSFQPRYRERSMPIRKTESATPPTEIAKRIRSVNKFFRATSSIREPWRIVVYSYSALARNRRGAQPLDIGEAGRWRSAAWPAGVGQLDSPLAVAQNRHHRMERWRQGRGGHLACWGLRAAPWR